MLLYNRINRRQEVPPSVHKGTAIHQEQKGSSTDCLCGSYQWFNAGLDSSLSTGCKIKGTLVGSEESKPRMKC